MATANRLWTADLDILPSAAPIFTPAYVGMTKATETLVYAWQKYLLLEPLVEWNLLIFGQLPNPQPLARHTLIVARRGLPTPRVVYCNEFRRCSELLETLLPGATRELVAD